MLVCIYMPHNFINEAHLSIHNFETAIQFVCKMFLLYTTQHNKMLELRIVKHICVYFDFKRTLAEGINVPKQKERMS